MLYCICELFGELETHFPIHIHQYKQNIHMCNRDEGDGVAIRVHGIAFVMSAVFLV